VCVVLASTCYDGLCWTPKWRNQLLLFMRDPKSMKHSFALLQVVVEQISWKRYST
jgi:hypothetical protein